MMTFIIVLKYLDVEYETGISKLVIISDAQMQMTKKLNVTFMTLINLIIECFSYSLNSL